jgi:hypothetical protein
MPSGSYQHPAACAPWLWVFMKNDMRSTLLGFDLKLESIAVRTVSN